MKKAQRAPAFIGIGVMKAATTWIFSCLSEHPEISVGSKKEIHFFDHPNEYRKGIDHYFSYFGNCDENTLCGEFTPSYMFSDEAPLLIAKHLPNVKLIACLRDPANRAISHYKYNVYEGGRLGTYKNFKEAITKDRELFERGRYFSQLEKYYERFPSENIHIVIYEQLQENPLREIREIFAFLDVDTEYVPEQLSSRSNITGKRFLRQRHPRLVNTIYFLRRLIPRQGKVERAFQSLGIYSGIKGYISRNKEVDSDGGAQHIYISDAEKSSLRDAYRSEIERLEHLIQKDLSIWKS